MSALNENIKKFREYRKMTQKQFADGLSKSRNVISNWERGENSPDPDTIEQICKILGVTPNMIFGWEPCPEYEKFREHMEERQRKIESLIQKKCELEKMIFVEKMKLKNDTFIDE